MSRTSNSLKMVVASTANQIAVVICGFLLPPLFISHFGSEMNGLLNAVKQMMAYFGIVCLGLGSAAQVALYKPIVDNDWKRINAILAATKHFFNQSGMIFLALVLVSSLIFPLLFKSGIPLVDVFLIVLITGIGSISEYIIVAKYKVFLSAGQKNYINSRITTEGILLNTACSILLIYAGCSVIIIQICSTAVYIVRLLLTIRYVRCNYPMLSFTSEERDDKALSSRWSAFSYQVANIVISLSPAIVIGALCSLSDVSVYSIYFMLFSALMMIAGVFSAGLSAPFGDILVKKETETLNKAFRCYEFVYTCIIYICFTCSVVLLPSFIRAYIHNTDGVNYVLPMFSMLMCLNYVSQCSRTPFKTIIEAKGLFKENYKLNLVEAFSFVVISVVFVLFWGLNGIALAGILTSLPRTVKYVVDACCLLSTPNTVLRFLKKQFLNIIFAMALWFFVKNDASPVCISEWILYALPYLLCLSFITVLFNICIDLHSFKLIKELFVK